MNSAEQRRAMEAELERMHLRNAALQIALNESFTMGQEIVNERVEERTIILRSVCPDCAEKLGVLISAADKALADKEAALDAALSAAAESRRSSGLVVASAADVAQVTRGPRKVRDN